MIPDAEVISVVCSILSRLDVGEFTIKVCLRTRHHVATAC